MERRFDPAQPRFTLLWRLLQSKNELPEELPLQPSRYAVVDLELFQSDNLTNSVDFKFLRPLYHPNIYPDGRLCISILHQPGDDEMSGESASERWSPAQRVESVLISILSLLDDAEVSSPANVDAGVMIRKEPDKYKELVKADTEKSKTDIPDDFTMPTAEQAFQKHDDVKAADEYWYDSDAGEDDFDFGGSDSEVDVDMEVDAFSERGGEEEDEDEDED